MQTAAAIGGGGGVLGADEHRVGGIARPVNPVESLLDEDTGAAAATAASTTTARTRIGATPVGVGGATGDAAGSGGVLPDAGRLLVVEA